MIIRTISILCLSFSLFCGEAEAPKLPQSVQSIINKAEATVQKNRVAYDNANDKAFSDTEKQLKSELDKLTKAGKLEEAMAVKKTIETFRTDVVSKVDENAKRKESGDLLGDSENTLKPGKYKSWTAGWSGTIEIQKDGKTIFKSDNVTGELVTKPNEGVCINYSNNWHVYGIVWNNEKKLFVGENRSPTGNFKEPIFYSKL
jgi:hypothetical protein